MTRTSPPRLLARGLAAVLCMLLAATLLPGVAFAADNVKPAIRPQQRDTTAVRNSQRVEISGTAPAGDIQGARLLAMRRNGDIIAEQIVPDGDLNKLGAPGVTNDYIRNDDGTLSGQLTLGCKFAQPTGEPNSCAPEGVEVVALQVTVAGQTGRSNTVRVDYLRPGIDGYEVIRTNRIRVVFSEPVRHEQGDSPSDWVVVEPARVVVAVENPPEADCREPKDYPEAEHECTRVLVLDQPLHEDDTPTVDYTNTGDAVPTRTAYRDFADNRAFTIGLARLVAVDLVRPAKPNIESIDGKAPSGGEVHSTDSSPQVRLTNLTAGHEVRLTVTGREATTQPQPVRVPQGATSVDITIPDLPADGGYAISSTAVDPHGNRSDEDAKSPPRDDGARHAAQYVLDTVAPRVVQATLVNTRTVDVLFNEAAYPAGNAGEWKVGTQRVTAEGQGAQRRLVSPVDLGSRPGALSWTPTSDQPGTTGRYGDRAGNAMAAVSALSLGELPIVSTPTVTVPPGETYTNASSQRIEGTASDQANLVAELFDRGAEQPRRSTQVSGGRWAFDEPLASDRRFQFEVRLRDTQTGMSSPRAAVPDIVRDTVKPVVDVTEPAPAPLSLDNPTERRQRYGVGASVPIRWRATDSAPGDGKNPDHGSFVDIVAVYGDGTRRVAAERLAYQAGQEQVHHYTLTQADLGGRGTREITFEVVVTDLANNRGTDASSPILLVADLVDYAAGLVKVDTIEARFPVALAGDTLAAEWSINGVLAQNAKKTTRDGVTVIVLTWATNSDPNATPTVQYQPVFVNPTPLRTENGTEISRGVHEARDEIVPALSVNTGDSGGYTNADQAHVSGTTDASARPNTVRAYRADASGNPQGEPVAAVLASSNGQWTVEVPLARNTANHFVVRAGDPNGNNSAPRPSPPYLVIQDAIAPTAVAARLVNRRTVDVVLSEPVVPAGHAGRWFVRSGGQDVPVTAEGSDAQRRLVASTDLTDVEAVRWEPTGNEPGTAGRYGDRARNGMSAIAGLPLSDLPPLAAPGITTPSSEVYTRANRIAIAGTAPDQSNLVAELFERGADQPRASAPVSSSRWSFDQALDADRRYHFEVRLRDTQTGTTSQRIAVADVVRDTTKPVVDVVFPDPRPPTLDEPTEQRRQYGVGSSVPIRWRATDEAPNDPQRPDHGDFATIFLVAPDGSRRVIADGIAHQPGQEQSYSYTLRQADLAGQASRELRFEVAVTDLAANRGAETSAPILLLADLIGFQPALVASDRIDVRFPVVVVGETVAGEWYVDGTPAQQAQKTEHNGATVVRLTVAHNSDPNWTPGVRYQPLAVNPAPLRSDGGAKVSREEHITVDEIAPALTVQVPDTGNRPIDADSIALSGTTDRTNRPNTVFVFRTDASGAPQGSPVASTVAGSDGQWRLDVPLTQDAVNRLVARAADPSGNRSAAQPDPPVTVTEDSLAPVVHITSPKSASLVAPVLDITWQTIEANKESVRIDYRVGSHPWQPVADRIEDSGAHRWEIPEQVQTEVFSLRVTATDQAAKTGSAAAAGLRLDLEAPTIVKARASGAQVVDVTFSEPVTLDGSGFTIGGAAVRRIKGDGLRRTFILNRAIDSTTPQVDYAGTNVRDEAGNELAASSLRARRAFAFGVKGLRGQRVTPNRVRVAWKDDRNRPADLRGYRIYRDGAPIALVGASTRAFTDAKGKGRHVYSVRAVDDRRRVSSIRRVVVRR